MIAVTGASGFVGRQVVREAIAAGCDVVGLTRSQNGARHITACGARSVVMPRLDPEACARAFDGALAVVHLAQIGAERDGARYDVVNVEGTRAVLAGARRAGVQRIVFLSGLGVADYGRVLRCTNPYFLSKLTCELELLRADIDAIVLRPSYILGPGDALLTNLLREMAAGVATQIGDGAYRLQPVAVRDVAALVLILATIERPGRAVPFVFDLVGPEPVSFKDFRERLVRRVRVHGRAAEHRVAVVTLTEALERAQAGGYQGMLPDELDCLLCDVVADSGPLAVLLGHPLTPLDAALEAALAAPEGLLESGGFPG